MYSTEGEGEAQGEGRIYSAGQCTCGEHVRKMRMCTARRVRERLRGKAQGDEG